jgi:hypothetical protein
MPITHDNVVSLRLAGSKLVITTWSEHSDPWMLGHQGSLRPNTYEFSGKVRIRSLRLSPEDAGDPEELVKELAEGRTVTLTSMGRRPRVEVDYEYRDGVFDLDIAVKWS